MSDISTISFSDDPIMECRKYICKFVYAGARYEAPTIYPSPQPDYSGFRGLPGITGELYEYMDQLITKDSILKEFLWDQEVSDELKKHPNFPYTALLRASSEIQLQVNAANILRIHLDDYKSDPEKDWFRKFIEIELASAESHYRGLLSLPDVLEKQSGLGASAGIFYPVFYNLIINGTKNPRYEWEEMTRKNHPN